MLWLPKSWTCIWPDNNCIFGQHDVTGVALSNNKKQSKTEAELRQADDLINNHRLVFGQTRRKVEEIKQTALMFADDNMFMQIDSMDNNKSLIPRYLVLSKDVAQKERLPAKVTGCTIYSGMYEQKRKVFMFINHDIFENGSNFIITIIYQLLLDFLKDHGKFPRKLHLNCDNCWKGKLCQYLKKKICFGFEV